MKTRRSIVNDMFQTKADAYNGALDRAVLVIGLHASDKGPEEVMEILKLLKTDTSKMKA